MSLIRGSVFCSILLALAFGLAVVRSSGFQGDSGRQSTKKTGKSSQSKRTNKGITNNNYQDDGGGSGTCPPFCKTN
jgi:hypothetical protein